MPTGSMAAITEMRQIYLRRQPICKQEHHQETNEDTPYKNSATHVNKNSSFQNGY
jgi:hypothetical protein